MSPVKPLKKLAWMTYRFTMGFGVDLVVSRQMQYFLKKNYQVLLLTFLKDDYHDVVFKKELDSGQLTLRTISDAGEAISHLRAFGADAVLMHTPPFFDLIPELRKDYLTLLMDYGEPPAALFPDRAEREKLFEKRKLLGGECDCVISISEFVRKDSGIPGAEALLIGNDHLWDSGRDYSPLAGSFRKKTALSGEFLVLNVTRFHRGERLYKGLEEYLRVREAFYGAYPHLQNEVCFLLAGRGSERDMEWARSCQLLTFNNLSEEELIAAYLDSQFYLSTSQWEGFNLGLGQALSFGMDCAASDRGAHAELGVFVSNDPPVLAERIKQSYESFRASATDWKQRLRNQKLFPWDLCIKKLEEIILKKWENKSRK